jgi:hypothetical protein
MRKIFRFLKDYQRKHFDAKLYGSIAVFLFFCFLINYRFDFEDSVIDSYYDTPLHWLFMFLFHLFPFLGVCFILYFFGKQTSWLKSRAFWIRVIIGFSILAFDRAFSGGWILSDDLQVIDYRFLGKSLRWSSSLFVSVIPLLLVYLMLERDHEKTYYGLAWKKFDAKPYFILLGIAALFIAIGSFFSDIQNYYPRYQYSGGERYAETHGLPPWVTILMYELAYGSDFVSVELFFRGFLIHAFVRTLGGYAVLPMIATYAFLHFGKPMTEAISSVFGGYLLGIISYNTRNVWGGIIIHMGVAWVMELFGYLQRL